MRKFITLLLVISVFAANAQSDTAGRLYMSADTLVVKDTAIKFIKVNGHVRQIGKKDTVSIPVYVKERIDTSKQTTVIYEGRKGRIYRANGYFIYRTLVGTMDGLNYQAVDQPQVIGALNEKKRQVKPILQQ